MSLRTETVRLTPPAGSARRDPIDFEVVAGDAFIGPAITRGMWEEHETRLFHAHVRPGSRVVDLGANVGWYAVQGILAGAEVHSFEPVPQIAEIARRNIERANEAGAGMGTLYEMAAGSEVGSARIVLSENNFGDNRVIDQGGEAPGDLSGSQEIEIQIGRVDDHVQGGADVLKVDTQGSEWHALQGAKKLLGASPDLALLLEFWPYALRGTTPEELLNWLGREGFTVGKATAAPFPMNAERLMRQAKGADPVKGGIDLYATRGKKPFHALGLKARLHGMARSMRED